MTDAIIRRRLWVMLCLYEALIISIVAAAGLNISLSGGGSLFLAAPLLLISCAEALRIPLSAMATRLRWGGQLLAAIALLGIAVGSAEGLGVAFQILPANRVVDIMRANLAPSIGPNELSTAKRRRTPASRAKVTCAGHRSHGAGQPTGRLRPPLRIGTPSAPGEGSGFRRSADASAIAVYRETQKEYDARLASLSSQRLAARAKQMSAVSPRALDARTEAKQAFEEKADQRRQSGAA